MSEHLKHLRFECTGCGNCCTGSPRDYWVEVSDREQRHIADYLGISLRWLRRRYMVREPDGDGLSMHGDACVFLDGKRCRIYPVRPTQCRTYPYWPELLGSRAAWRAEAKRCEGIGRGKPLPVKRVIKILARSNSDDRATKRATTRTTKSKNGETA